MDMITTFLNASLNEEIYISQLDGYIQPGQKTQVCRFLKSLYGLKQAPHAWYELIGTFLLSQSFTKYESHLNVYFKRYKNSMLLLGLYFDDLILISDNLEFLTMTKAMFAQYFSMTDNQDIEYILGIQIQQNRSQHILTL